MQKVERASPWHCREGVSTALCRGKQRVEFVGRQGENADSQAEDASNLPAVSLFRQTAGMGGLTLSLIFSLQ